MNQFHDLHTEHSSSTFIALFYRFAFALLWLLFTLAFFGITLSLSLMLSRLWLSQPATTVVLISKQPQDESLSPVDFTPIASPPPPFVVNEALIRKEIITPVITIAASEMMIKVPVVPTPMVTEFLSEIKPYTSPTEHMDGETALAYARTRHGNSDIYRAERQQAVIEAVRKRALSSSYLPLLPNILRQEAKKIETNLSLSDLFFLARFAQELQSNRIYTYVLKPPLLWNGTTADGQMVLLYDPYSLQQSVHQWLYDASLPLVTSHSP